MAYEVTNNSTVHGENTPFGFSTPHRFPTAPSENLTDIMSGLARQLYPTGRAWWMQNNTNFDNLHKAINRSFIRFIESCDLTIDSTIPDTTRFNEDDCTLWEYRLGLKVNPPLDVDTRKEIIKRKMTFPSNVIARGTKEFIEYQLQLAGFDVWVHENEIPYQTPNDIIALSLELTMHGGGAQHGGGTQHGYLNFDVIANEAVTNESYSVGSDLWPTFFIGGENLGDIATIPATRLIEFKELVLKLKHAHKVVYTFINFV